MMLQLAQWLMQGRWQSIVFVLATSLSSVIFLPNMILAAAAMVLITLRHGIKEGSILGLWAIIPASIFAFYWQAITPLLLIIASLGCAQVLRTTQSWSLSLLLLSLLGLVTSTTLVLLASPWLEQFIASLLEVINIFATQSNSPEQQADWAEIRSSFTVVTLAGLFGTNLVIIGFLGVALGRSWQAKLYNQGGFQLEFHQLRLGKYELILAVSLSLVLLALSKDLLLWISMSLFPLLVAGIALFHAYAAHKGLSKTWYVVFYALLILLNPLKIILVSLAAMDVFINYRRRFLQND